MSANFVGNTLTQSEAIETYTPYDVTSSRPRKTTIALFANFGRMEKLFCAPDQSLNSKIIYQCNIGFKKKKKKRELSFHFIGTLKAPTIYSIQKLSPSLSRFSIFHLE